MAKKPAFNFSPFFRWLYYSFLRKQAEDKKEESTADKKNGAGFFSLMLGDFFHSLGNKDSDSPIDNSKDEGEESEPISNPLIDLLKKKAREADKSDFHEDASGKQKTTWTESENGEERTPEHSEDSEDHISAASDIKLGKASASARVTTEGSSVSSEALVPEHVVFNEIGEAKQIFDWRRILRQNSNYDVDWSFRNAVVEDGIVRPTLEAVPSAKTEILLDTSGSIDEPLLKRFLQECCNILPFSQVRVGCFDTRFYGFKEIRSPRDLENMVFEGRHGTSFSAAVNAFSGRVDNRIIFTDGEAPMPSVKMDVIWIVFGGKRIAPNGGRVFYVDDDLMNRLKK